MMAQSHHLPKGAKQLLYESHDNAVYLCEYDMGPELGLRTTPRKEKEEQEEKEENNEENKESPPQFPQGSKKARGDAPDLQPCSTLPKVPATWMVLNLSQGPLPPKSWHL